MMMLSGAWVHLGSWGCGCWGLGQLRHEAVAVLDEVHQDSSVEAPRSVFSLRSSFKPVLSGVVSAWADCSHALAWPGPWPSSRPLAPSHPISIPVALLDHLGAVSDPGSPHQALSWLPPVGWHPSLTSVCPWPQGGAQCSGLGLLPKLLAGAVGPALAARPCTAHPRRAPMPTALPAPRELLAPTVPCHTVLDKKCSWISDSQENGLMYVKHSWE